MKSAWWKRAIRRLLNEDHICIPGVTWLKGKINLNTFLYVGEKMFLFTPDRYFQDIKKSLDTFPRYIKNNNNSILGLYAFYSEAVKNI